MAENTFQKSSITIEAAERIVKAAEAKAKEMGKPMCIAVCDEDGTLKAFRRMDGAPSWRYKLHRTRHIPPLALGAWQAMNGTTLSRVIPHYFMAS